MNTSMKLDSDGFRYPVEVRFGLSQESQICSVFPMVYQNIFHYRDNPHEMLKRYAGHTCGIGLFLVDEWNK